MAKKDFVCEKGLISEGNMGFPSQGDASYRYKVESTTDTVRFRLEDRKSKKQWQSKELKQSGFVNTENTIPQATMRDYVKCRVLKAHGVLKFATALTMFDFVWFPTYQFTLTPIPLEPIDLLAAHLRDAQDEVAALRGEKPNKSGLKRAELTLMTTTEVSAGQLLWRFGKCCDKNKVCSIQEGRMKIRFLCAGDYYIKLTLNLQNYNDGNCHVELQRDGELFQTRTFYTTNYSTATFCHSQAVKMAEGEALSVANCASNYISKDSTLSITLAG